MTQFDDSMFAEVRSAIKDKKANNTSFSNMLRFAPKKDGTPNTYTVRILPNVKDPKNTFFKYITYDWNSLSTGNWINVVSPTTFGERCPIQETKTKAFRSKTSTPEEIEKARLLKRTEHWLVNVYVIDDPDNPQNNGTIKFIKIGKQLYNKIVKVSDEDDPDSYLGDDIFLKPNDSLGYNFKIVVKKEAAYPTYNESEFARKPATIDGISTPEDIAAIYEKTFDLKTINPIKSYEEIENILNEHYFVSIEKITSEQSSTNYNNIPTQQTSEISSVDEVDEDFINDILNNKDK